MKFTKKLLSFMMAAMMAVGMLTGCGGSGSSTTGAAEEEKAKDPSPEYVELLSKYGLKDVNYDFVGKKSVVLGMAVSDETLEIMAFGYTGDIAEEMYDKVYMDISEYDDETIDMIDQQIRDSFESVGDLPFATIEFEVDKDFGMYIIEIHYDNLSKENVKTLIEQGLISGTEGMNQISIKQTLDSAAENGLIVR